MDELKADFAIVSGSCSTATQAQVAAFTAAGGKAFAIDPLRLAAGDDPVRQALAWARSLLGEKPVLVYATADANAVKSVQDTLGASRAGTLVEGCLARVAQGLVQAGVAQVVVAGGETSGACVQAPGAVYRRADRPWSAVVLCADATHSPGVEIRHLWPRRLLQPRLHGLDLIALARARR